MTTPILQSEDEHRLVLEAPRMAATIFGLLSAVVLLTIWTVLPSYRIAQAIFLLMAVAGLSGRLHVHRLTLDLDARRWHYRDGWVWQGAIAEGGFDDLGRVAVEHNLVQDGLVASKLRSRLVFLEFDRFDVPGQDGRFPLGFAMGPHVAPEQARHFAERLGIQVEDRTSGPPPEPESSRPATPPTA